MKSVMTWSLAVMVGMGGLTGAGMTRANEPQPVQPAPVVKQAEAGRMTDEQLSTLIKGLGYTEKTLTSEDGKITYHSLNLLVVNFRYVIDISLQNDGATIYFSCPLRKIGEPEKVPAEKFLALLGKNDEMAPMFFSYSASRKQLFLNYEIDNRTLTPAQMQESLDKLKHLLNSTFALWDTSKWPGGPQPQPAAVKAPTATADSK